MPPICDSARSRRKRHIAHRQRTRLQGRGDLLRGSGHDSPGSRGLTALSITCGRRRACVRLEPAGTDRRGFRRPADAPASSPQDTVRFRARATRSPAASLLFGNDDVTLARCRPDAAAGGAVPQRRRRRGRLRPLAAAARCTRCSARCHFATSITSSSPAARPIASNSRPAAEPDLLVIESAGNVSIPARYLNPTASCGWVLLTASAISTARARSRVIDRERGDDASLIKDGRRLTRYTLASHPFDVVGWDGMVYPYTFNADDFEPITGTRPPAAAGAADVRGPGLRGLHVRAPDARHRSRGDQGAVRPFERAVRRGAVLRAGPVRQPAGRRGVVVHAPSRAASPTGRIPARSSPAAMPARPTSWPSWSTRSGRSS